MNKRVFDMELAIDAEPSAVWRALTEAEELTRWFPPIADVVPGEGGKIRLTWSDDLTGDCVIKVWEPESRLKISWFEPTEGEVNPERVLFVDFLIESDHGGTVLRLHHSGFGADESWDTEYDSVSRGWTYELRSLRHYLERHAGKKRYTVLRRYPVTADTTATWVRLVGENGIFRHGALPEEGGAINMTLPDGVQSDGRLVLNLDGTDFAAALDVLDDGILRLCLDSCTGDLQLWLWLTSWSLESNVLDAMVDAWSDSVTQSIG